MGLMVFTDREKKKRKPGKDESRSDVIIFFLKAKTVIFPSHYHLIVSW